MVGVGVSTGGARGRGGGWRATFGSPLNANTLPLGQRDGDTTAGDNHTHLPTHTWTGGKIGASNRVGG